MCAIKAASRVSRQKMEKEAHRKKPKKALSAYNYFFQSERALILGIDVETLERQKREGPPRKHRKTPGMNGLRGMAIAVGKKWNEMSEADKAPFRKRSNADKERYAREIAQWERESYASMDMGAFFSKKKSSQGNGRAPKGGKKPNSTDKAKEQVALLSGQRLSSNMLDAETTGFSSIDGTFPFSGQIAISATSAPFYVAESITSRASSTAIVTSGSGAPVGLGGGQRQGSPEQLYQVRSGLEEAFSLEVPPSVPSNGSHDPLLIEPTSISEMCLSWQNAKQWRKDQQELAKSCIMLFSQQCSND